MDRGRRRVRAALSNGADFTSSSNCFSIVPIRMTLAGSSTRSRSWLPLAWPAGAAAPVPASGDRLPRMGRLPL